MTVRIQPSALTRYDNGILVTDPVTGAAWRLLISEREREWLIVTDPAAFLACNLNPCPTFEVMRQAGNRPDTAVVEALRRAIKAGYDCRDPFTLASLQVRGKA